MIPTTRRRSLGACQDHALVLPADTWSETSSLPVNLPAEHITDNYSSGQTTWIYLHYWLYMTQLKTCPNRSHSLSEMSYFYCKICALFARVLSAHPAYHVPCSQCQVSLLTLKIKPWSSKYFTLTANQNKTFHQSSGILIHPAVWPQQLWAKNWGLCPLFGEGSWVPI